MRGQYWGGSPHSENLLPELAPQRFEPLCHTKEALLFSGSGCGWQDSGAGWRLSDGDLIPPSLPCAACTRWHPCCPQSSLPAILLYSGERGGGGCNFYKVPAYPLCSVSLFPPLKIAVLPLVPPTSSFFFLNEANLNTKIQGTLDNVLDIPHPVHT